MTLTVTGSGDLATVSAQVADMQHGGITLGLASWWGQGTIDGWHRYGPASAVQDFSTAPGDGSYAISPGYWKSSATYGTAPFLARDRARGGTRSDFITDLHANPPS